MESPSIVFIGTKFVLNNLCKTKFSTQSIIQVIRDSSRI